MTELRIVSSNEKGLGNIFIYTSYALTSLFLLGICKALFEGDIKPAFLFLPFLFVCLMLYLFGKSFNNKYNKLGATPLTINATIIPKDTKQKAAITINQSNFNCVKEIQLKCLKISHSSQGDSSTTHTLFDRTLDCEPIFSGDITTLNFDYEIPAGMPCSSKGRNKNGIYWEFSFNFRDGINIVTRTWTVDVT